MQVTCETKKGGAVVINKKQGVSVSYAVATVGDSEPSEILYVWVTLHDGRRIQFFFNRETNLAVLDVINKRGTGGIEVLRMTV